MVKRLFSSIEKFLHQAEDRIEEWRRQDQARKAEAEVHRDELWAEAVEREKLLAEAIGEEEARRYSAEEDTGRRRFVFVVHSGEASEALESLAGEGYSLVSALPGGGNTGAGVTGSWLVFEAPPSESSRRALRSLNGSVEASAPFLR